MRRTFRLRVLGWQHLPTGSKPEPPASIYPAGLHQPALLPDQGTKQGVELLWDSAPVEVGTQWDLAWQVRYPGGDCSSDIWL